MHPWFRERFTRDQPPEVTGQTMIISAVRQIWFSWEWTFLVTNDLEMLHCVSIGQGLVVCILHTAALGPKAPGAPRVKINSVLDGWTVNSYSVLTVLWRALCVPGSVWGITRRRELLIAGLWGSSDYTTAYRKICSVDAQESSCSSADNCSCPQSCESHWLRASVRSVKKMLTLQ